MLDKQNEIIDIAKTLQRCADEMARLKRMEEELNKRMAALMEHGEGEKTYSEAGYKIKVTRTLNYSLDKEEYEIIKNQIRPEFDPVRKVEQTKIVYNLDKSVIRQYKKYADDTTLSLLDTIVKEKPETLKVVIGSI